MKEKGKRDSDVPEALFPKRELNFSRSKQANRRNVLNAVNLYTV